MSASSAEVSTRAAAPSEMLEELAAVNRPSLPKAARSVGILSGWILQGASSVSNVVSPLRDCTVTGAISALNAPEAMACLARVALSTA